MRLGERLVWTLGLLLALTACHKGSATGNIPLLPPPTPAAVAFDDGAQAFAANDYAEADRNFRKYLELVPARSGKRDEVFFHLALMSALPKTGTENWPRVTSWLNQLVSEFPRSPLKPAAQTILKLSVQMATETEKRDQRIRQLTTELDRLKQIDSERRQRP